MRIWHQSFTVLEDLPPYTERIRAHAKKMLSAGNEIVLHGQIPGTFPTNYPGNDVSQNLLFHLHGIQWMLAGMQAEAEGYDAYLICTVPDPMLWEVRGLLGIPTIGYGESAYQLACRLGRKFGIIKFIERMTAYTEDQVERYGLSSRFVGAHMGSSTFQDIQAGFSNPGPVIDKFREDARALIRRGADAIVCGGMPLDILMATEGVNRVDDVPIIDGLAASVKAAEMMVELNQKAGMQPCRRGYYGTPPSRERLDQVLAFYGIDKLKNSWKSA
jgi:Asp/Glu/hydantoin racemase